MSFPSVLGPWFVVQKFKSLAMLGEMYYYRSQEEGGDCFTESKRGALLFMSLASAARVAAAEGAEVRVLTTKEEAKEFGRD